MVGPELAVEVRELVKHYPRSLANAVDELSFVVARGEVFGLLGPNGAGKTTTIGVLTTRVLPTSGSARVTGLDVVADPVRVRSRLAVVPQRMNLDRSLTTRNNLVFHAAYHSVPRAERKIRADEMLERMGLAAKARESVDRLSGGQSQRLMIARGLMHRPEVLFLDEPSTGLDPQARLFVHDQVRSLRDEGITVVLTMHDMDEAAKLSDRVGHRGPRQAARPGLPAEVDPLAARQRDDRSGRASRGRLGRVAGGRAVRDGIVEQRRRTAGRATGGHPAARRHRRRAPAARLRRRRASCAARRRGRGAGRPRGAAVTDLSLGEPTLEDVFIHLTGRDLR